MVKRRPSLSGPRKRLVKSCFEHFNWPSGSTIDGKFHLTIRNTPLRGVSSILVCPTEQKRSPGKHSGIINNRVLR